MNPDTSNAHETRAFCIAVSAWSRGGVHWNGGRKLGLTQYRCSLHTRGFVIAGAGGCLRAGLRCFGDAILDIYIDCHVSS